MLRAKIDLRPKIDLRLLDRSQVAGYLVLGCRATKLPTQAEDRDRDRFSVCVYYCRTFYKAVRVGGEEESGGHVL